MPKKKRKTKSYLYFLLLILLIPFVLGEVAYTKTGTVDSDYIRGFGEFDSITAGIESRTLTNPVQLPLVADLDNNGDYEIITLSYGSIRLFRDRNLTTVKSLTIENYTYSNMIVFDIDGDSKEEIIIGFEENRSIRTYEYNGSALFEDSNIDLATIGTNITTDGGEFIIGCRDTDECLLTWSQKTVGGGGQAYLYAVPFTSTTVNPVHLGLRTTLWANGVWCSPYIRDMAVVNINPETSTDKDYIFNYYTLETATITMRNYVIGITVTGGTMSKFLDFYQDESSALVDDQRCEYEDRKSITPVLVADLEDGGDYEIAFAKNYAPDDFKIYAYDSIGNLKGTYPAVAYGTGEIISNVFVASSHDTGNDDFCVMGYSQVDDKLELVCGSLDNEPYGFLTDLFGAKTNVFYTDEGFLSDNYNLTSNRIYSPLAHSVQYRLSGQPIASSEIVTSYGVFELDYGGLDCYTYSSCNLVQIYDNPKKEGAMIPTDAENSGQEDLLLLTNNNLFYLDDTFSNSGVSDILIELDPCTDQGNGIWKLNTTVKVYVTPIDPESDFVSTRSILYYETPNQQEDNWSSYLGSGTEFTSTFTANKTITNGILRIEARDIENPTNILFTEISFTVAENGLEFGDCRETIGIERELEDDEVVLPDICSNDNDCPSGYLCVNDECIVGQDIPPVQDIKDILSPFGISITIFWIVLMLVITYALWVGNPMAESNPNIAIGVIVIFNFLALILGTLLGIINIGILISIIVIALIIIGMWFRKVWTGS